MDRQAYKLGGWIGCIALGLLLSACQSRAPLELPPAAKVTVLQGRNNADTRRLIKALRVHLGQRMQVMRLGSKTTNNRVLKAARKPESGQVVAIGPRAARLARYIKDKQIIFVRVFNYQAIGMKGDIRKGVSVLPDSETVFDNWKQLSPKLRNVGIITGHSTGNTLADIRASASHYGIRIHHVVVRNDKEMVYAARKMARKVDGYWLLPDERILSGSSIRRFMGRAVRDSKQVVSYTPSLLKLGALMSVEPTHQSIAERLNERLADGYYRQLIPGPTVDYARDAEIRISAMAAKRLGLMPSGRQGQYVIKR